MKQAAEIYSEMMAAFRQKTGLDVSGGGDLAVRLSAVAAQLESLYAQSDWVARECFPQTATGQRLDYHGQVRGITRRKASSATGKLRFLVDAAAPSPLTVPKGTVCLTAGLVRFETDAAAVIQTGATQTDVTAHAIEPGTAGNAAPGAILTMAVPPMGVAHCTNPQAFAGGQDEEGDEGLRFRVLETYQRLPNGANTAFYQQGAMSFEQVVAASVVPRPRGVGTVDVVIATAAGLPGSALLAEVADYFASRREIAVEVQVKAPTAQNVTLTLAVKPKQGVPFAEVKAEVEAALRGYFTGARLGCDILRAKLGELVYSAEGVENYAISSPSADVTVGQTVLPRLQSLTITEMT